ncbi:MAG: hypothetical protein HY077_03600 [Elusimicrobia bacterium]|nr:hypothetical protein [Elusimicrobiota bacterium]
MKNSKLFLILCLGALAAPAVAADAAGKKSAAELEKEKALSNPYPNDFGPDKLTDEELKDYPADKKAGYKILLSRCAQCHTPSRPLNSRFVEPDAGAVKPDERDAKEGAAIAKMKGEHADWFKEGATWQIEAGIWNRYVKRMMNKPGCGVSAGGKMTNPEAKQIYEFLVYDGQRRKLGAKAEKWKAHREKLVSELKTKKPARYEELKKDNDL